MLKAKKGSVAPLAKKEVLKSNEFKGFYVKLTAAQYWKLQDHLNALRITKLEWLTEVIKEVD